MGLLNSFLQIDMTTNSHLTGFAAFGNYELKIAYYNNPLLLQELKLTGPIFATFNDYNI